MVVCTSLTVHVLIRIILAVSIGSECGVASLVARASQCTDFVCFVLYTTELIPYLTVCLVVLLACAME